MCIHQSPDASYGRCRHNNTGLISFGTSDQSGKNHFFIKITESYIRLQYTTTVICTNSLCAIYMYHNILKYIGWNGFYIGSCNMDTHSKIIRNKKYVANSAYDTGRTAANSTAVHCVHTPTQLWDFYYFWNEKTYTMDLNLKRVKNWEFLYINK